MTFVPGMNDLEGAMCSATDCLNMLIEVVGGGFVAYLIARCLQCVGKAAGDLFFIGWGAQAYASKLLGCAGYSIY